MLIFQMVLYFCLCSFSFFLETIISFLCLGFVYSTLRQQFVWDYTCFGICLALRPALYELHKTKIFPWEADFPIAFRHWVWLGSSGRRRRVGIGEWLKIWRGEIRGLGWVGVGFEFDGVSYCYFCFFILLSQFDLTRAGPSDWLWSMELGR